MDRKQAHAIYHQLYTKKYPVIEADICQYCGTDVDLSVDHVPALTTAQLYSTRKDIDFILVVSCMECNSILSNDLLPLFNDRFFTVKERLLRRYKKDLIHEFRNGFNWDPVYLAEADQKFNNMLDRIGFGLVRFDELDEESQSILALEVDCYEETLGQLIANRTGGGLLAHDNIKHEDTEDDHIEEKCSYSKFLQVVNFQNIQSLLQYESWLEEHYENLKNYLLPDKPTVFYKKDWSDIWRESQELSVNQMPDSMDERDYCSFSEFIEVCVEREIESQKDYVEWFDENLWGAVISLDMPEAPQHIYGVTWKEILERAKYSETKDEEEFDEEYPEDIVSKLDIFESLLSTNELEKDLIMLKGRFVKFLNEAELGTYEAYLEFLDAVKDDGLAIHFPKDPIKDYDDWQLNGFYDNLPKPNTSDFSSDYIETCLENLSSLVTRKDSLSNSLLPELSFVSFLLMSKLKNEQEYADFYALINGHELQIHIPQAPSKAYPNWESWPGNL